MNRRQSAARSRRLRCMPCGKDCVVGALASVAVMLASLWTGTAPAVAAQACPNEAVREEQGAAGLALPDCRAYEMVSPPGSTPSVFPARDVAAAGGGRFAYYSLEPAPGSDEEGLYLLATRSSSGWSIQNTTPPQGGLHNSNRIACFPSVFYSSELTSAVLSDGWAVFEEGREQVCEGDYPPLVAGELRGPANLFVRDDEDGVYQLVDHLPDGQVPANALFLDATPDLSHMVFSEEAKLTPGAPEGADLYEWAGGADRFVTYLPSGEPVNGALVNGARGTATFTHAVSADGEAIFFYADGNLYARLNAGQEPTATGACSAGEAGKACTVQVDGSEAGAEGPGGGGTFVDASEDGSRVFFTDEHRLTTDATALKETPDLYEYNLETGVLSDLTVSSSGAASVLGFSGASTDGSYLYFVAKGVLTEGQVNSSGAVPVSDRPNLYLRHDGVTTFIATLEAGVDFRDWLAVEGQRSGEGALSARVSPNGNYIVFDSVEELTGYDNEPAESKDCDGGDLCPEIFLYDAGNNQLRCVSCVPDGESPTGSAKIGFPTEELLTPSRSPSYPIRNVLNDGSVFFDTSSVLAPRATNGEVNVYEYQDGNVSLISSGTGAGASEFLDASENGEDVFFATGQGLVQSDNDNTASVYDARVDGGFPAGSGEARGASACEGLEACLPLPAEAPAVSFPASATLPASGNLVAPPVPVTPGAHGEGSGKKRTLTKAQKLSRALKACARRRSSKRPGCERKARKRFGNNAGKHAEDSSSSKRLGHVDRRLGR